MKQGRCPNLADCPNLPDFTQYHKSRTTNGPRCHKSYLGGFRQSEIQTSELSYRVKLENLNYAYSKSRLIRPNKQITKALIMASRPKL